MNLESDLLIGFSKEDQFKVSTHLEKLLPYLDPDQYVLVGGIAIRYHLTQKGIKYSPRPFNDLDMIAKSASAIPSSVTNDFLIYHYHPQINNSFFIVLVDPESKTKIDIFDYKSAPQKLVAVNFRDHQVNLQSIEDQLIKTVADMLKVTQGNVVDPKQFSDAELLLQIADIKIAENFWNNIYYSIFQTSLIDAISKAKQVVLENPQLLKEKPFRRPTPYHCKDCRSTSNFPITPMKTIYKILGYVE